MIFKLTMQLKSGEILVRTIVEEAFEQDLYLHFFLLDPPHCKCIQLRFIDYYEMEEVA